MLKGEGVALVLGLHLCRLSVEATHEDALRLVVYPHHPSEVLRGRAMRQVFDSHMKRLTRAKEFGVIW